MRRVNLGGASRASTGVTPPRRSSPPPLDPDLAAFVAAHQRRLVRLLTLHAGNADVAQELAQEAMIRLCQHWPRVRTMDDPVAWLTRVAINLSTSRLRRRAAERRALARGFPDRRTVEAPDTETNLVVREAVAALPRRQRTALLLRFFADYSVSETAALMGCAEGTVKSLTSKALHALRAQEDDGSTRSTHSAREALQ